MKSKCLICSFLTLMLLSATAVQAAPDNTIDPPKEPQANNMDGRPLMDSIQVWNQGYQLLEKQKQTKDITISFAGDLTLGTYQGQAPGGRFDEVYEAMGNQYFLKNVKSVFSQDELTVVNLEGPLTKEPIAVTKEFPIKGEPEYAKILKNGDVDVVNLANNHTNDCGKPGYNETKKVLKEQGIAYFGEDTTSLYTTQDGIGIAFIGMNAWNDTAALRKDVADRIVEARKKAQLVIVMFHWGVENTYYPTMDQTALAHFVIDSGADLLVASHPHVMQGIETYKGKNIVYSMGNFCFGANKNPTDKETFIFQQSFTVGYDKQVSLSKSKVIPCRISSRTDANNFQPTILTGKEGDAVIERLKKYSSAFNTPYAFEN